MVLMVWVFVLLMGVSFLGVVKLSIILVWYESDDLIVVSYKIYWCYISEL